MIKGSLKDVSLPGLLQFLGNEGHKSYRLKVERGSAYGDLVILEGYLIAANYGLLSGEDAVCEFMTWEDGAFYIDRLSPRFQSTIEKNMNLKLIQISLFSDHASFLLENNIGLNTVIRPSRLFGTPEWQESSKLQPLQREDFLILGWLSGGRTMRQSMREFAFDLVQCTSILYRLILTRSVEVVRASGSQEIPGAPGENFDDNAAQLISQEIYASHEPLQKPQTAAPMPAVTPHPMPASPPETTVVTSAGAPDQAAVTPKPLAAPEKTTVADSKVTAEKAPVTVAVSQGDAVSPMQRTTVLPIISIDIERLMKAGFSITEFGFLALKNPSLDGEIRKLLLKVEAGDILESVVESSSRAPSAVLSTYKYCLDRGYISNPDPVLHMTADLLLGRVELDQYLLQRRRVTGEELRDLTEAARSSGVKLTQMLVGKGFLSQEDLDNVTREQLRFAMR